METYAVPDLFDDTPYNSLKAEGVTIVSYYQNEEVEKVNARLSRNLIVFVLSGRKTVLDQRRRKVVSAGEGFFLRKGNYLLSEKFGGQLSYHSYLFFFSDAFAHQFSRRHPDLVEPTAASEGPLSAFAANTELQNYLNSLRPYLSGSCLADSPDLAELKMQELFLLLAHTTESFRQFLQDLTTEPAHDLRQIMNTHYNEDLSLEQLAFLTNCSRSTFKRRFKEEFDTTPGKWIKQKRLEEAKLRLRSTAKNVSEICLEVGFENLSHFIQSFKEQFGTTPKQFQLEHAET